MSSLAKDCVDNFNDNSNNVQIIYINSYVLTILIYITAGCLVLIPLVLAIIISKIIF